MKACYWERGSWSRADDLWTALHMEKEITEKRGKPYIISLVGGGGKTSLIRRLAWEGRERGYKVLVLTTTHMAVPDHYEVLVRDRDEVEKSLERDHLAVSGKPEASKKPEEGRKISFWDWEFYGEICPAADLVLIEADGAKRLPVKVPRPGEPVIPENTDLILCVYGLSSLGKPVQEVCFRLKEAEKLLTEEGLTEEAGKLQPEEECLDSEKMALLMRRGYLKPLACGFPKACIRPVFNQADTEELEKTGWELAKGLMEEICPKVRETEGTRKAASGLVTGNLLGEVSAGLF